MPYDSKCISCPYNQQQHLPVNQRTLRNSPPIDLENNNSKTLLVFQAPGKDEWEVGKAIQLTIKVGGSAGRRINMSWERCQKQRTDFDIINSVQCFPGNEGKRDLEPDVMAICSCSQRLENVLESNEYSKIIVFGGIANQVITSICKKLNAKSKIIDAPHPNGGVSKETLDNLWQ